MKAGTTTLFDRVVSVPGVSTPAFKEPHFFSDGWTKGVSWYERLFDESSGVTGEASASYADAATIEVVSSRIRSVVPDVRLIYSLRNPVERMRSHYRHEVLRSRERRSFTEATADPVSPYVTRSLYGAVLDTLRRDFDRDQVMVVRMEDLDQVDTWNQILDHIGVARVPLPDTLSNTTEGKRQFTPLMLWLWERNLVPTRGFPRFVRNLARAAMTRPASVNGDLLDSAKGPIDDLILRQLRADRETLELNTDRRWSLWSDVL